MDEKADEKAYEKTDEKADEKAVVTSTESPDQSHKVCLIFTAPQSHSSKWGHNECSVIFVATLASKIYIEHRFR